MTAATGTSTFTPLEMRVTALDDRGRPTGPSFHYTKGSAVPDTDKTRDRPTRAAMEELESKRAYLERRLAEETSRVAELTVERDEWREARLPDLEAEAIAGCVRAIDQMRTGGGRNRGMASEVSFAAPARRWPARAQDEPVGRILLNLAARYGIELVDPPVPESSVDETPVLIPVPRHLADQIDRIVHQ